MGRRTEDDHFPHTVNCQKFIDKMADAVNWGAVILKYVIVIWHMEKWCTLYGT